MERLWVVTFIFAAVLISSVASLCLLCWLQGVQAEHRRKLMWRQLWHLAAADVLFGMFSIPVFIIDLLSTPTIGIVRSGTGSMGTTCVVLSLLYSCCFNTSILVETHLAVSFAATAYRCTAMLNALRQCIGYVWPLSVLFSVAEIYFDQPQWQIDQGCVNQMPDRMELGAGMICVFVGVASYSCSLLRMNAHSAGSVVRHRIRHRAQLYLLAWLVSIGPNLVRVSFRHNIFRDNWVLHLVALVLFNLKGLLNTLIYALQSRYVRRIQSRQCRGAVAAAKSGRVSEDNVSFHVGVGEADIVHVQSIAAEAIAESEREIAALEGSASVSSSGTSSTPSARPGAEPASGVTEGLPRSAQVASSDAGERRVGNGCYDQRWGGSCNAGVFIGAPPDPLSPLEHALHGESDPDNLLLGCFEPSHSFEDTVLIGTGGARESSETSNQKFRPPRARVGHLT